MNRDGHRAGGVVDEVDDVTAAPAGKEDAMNDTAPAAADEGALRIGVLGVLEVRSREEDRTPTAPMARRAMALLLLNANRLVSTSALIEELWEFAPPRLARKTVQTYVYQIRKALRCPGSPSERVRTGPGGYRLELRPGELDLWEFEHLVARARTALGEGDARGAAALLRQALALWRGEPFAGLESGPLLAAQIAQMADARLGALESRITADLQLGRHRALVGELRQVTGDHPLNEEFAAQLMLAAHRSGQRAVALEAFARLRRRLVDELGIEPSERLQRLQRDVLSEALPSGPAPAPVAVAEAVAAPGGAGAVPSVSYGSSVSSVSSVGGVEGAAGGAGGVGAVRGRLPLDTPDFTGRVPELERLAVLAGEESGGPRVVVVLGPAGVGKSALAVRGAHRLAGGFPDGVLHVRLHDDEDRPRQGPAVLRALLRDCGFDPAVLPGQTDELAGMFRSFSAGRALLVLLDDAAGTDQVLPLLPADGHSLALVTSRVRLPGLPGARSLSLGPLSAGDAAVFFTRVAGAERVAPGGEMLREVTRLMGDFPLSLRAVGEKFAARPMWTLPDLARGLVDEGHLAAELHDEACDVLARTAGAVARLPRALRRALALLAAAGAAPFGIAGARGLLGGDTWGVQSVVGRLLDHHVVVMVDRAEATGPSGPVEASDVLFRVPDLIRMSLPSPDDAELRVLPGAGGNLGSRSVAGVLTASG
ncbi:BTAD domain-containing putative transcriptional regulator [Streptomyces tagetis]|uniref:Winged helix-turn-helix domain-containing protein n=1 Tax=Streptomyces tagetis TaxID=2820809 RepID=A0A940XIK0_9ACTN|nr:BTAD domain-containing putative transcriptional regulator [Streptomyces sp. RG38]MBQ0827211.1 winged helix-turn-helix domain-containing protein [Streptomyces sp. RG38]